MVVSNVLAQVTTQLAAYRHPIMIIDLFVYTHTFVGCGFEYRCGWHALMKNGLVSNPFIYYLCL